ncbi:MAG: alpha/beta hydrolase [Eubacterium sp.]|nr:alpha/beta hydrolase [Eubacterium sp.]
MKICVLYPGIGYTTEMPLMYYPGKMTMGQGYELVRLKYHDLPSGVKGNKAKMKEAFDIALKQSLEQLSDVDWNSYDEVLFIGKSIGTAIAASCGQKLGLNKSSEIGSQDSKSKIKYVFLTPLEETFLFTEKASGIAFHGNSDPWAETDTIIRKCEEYDIPLYIYENANHSLETGNIIKDIETAHDVIQKVYCYIRGEGKE